VTDSPALDHSTAFNHPFYSSSKDPQYNPHQSLVYPPTPPIPTADIVPFPPSPVGPQPILGGPRADKFSHGLATPPLTPDDSIEDISIKSNDDALDLLTTLFSNHALTALPYAKSVTISSPEMGTSFDGVVLELPGKPKTFYVDGKSTEVVNVRERYANFFRSSKLSHSLSVSIVALLDLADEHLQCSALVIALEKASPTLSSLLHALMYVGGAVVTKPDFPVHPAYVLVGLEI
jgi:hypothetical protein